MVVEICLIPFLHPYSQTGFRATLPDVGGRKRSVKPWSRIPDGFPSMEAEPPTSCPLHLRQDGGGKSGDEARCRNDVVGSPAAQKGFAAGEHPRLACPGMGPAAALPAER